MSFNFKFSFILTIFNNEKYLAESFDSIINQDIGFDNNVQLIIVDCGSEDDSLNISHEYAEKFPKNIIVLSREGKSLANARNFALDYVEGEYVNFLDVGDYLSVDSLSEVYNFFKLNDDIHIISIPIKENKKIFETCDLNICDLLVCPNNPLLNLSSSFINTNLILDLKFNEDLIFSQDSLFLNKILLKEKKFAFIESPLYYRQSWNNPSYIFNQLTYKKELYTERLKKFHLELINDSVLKYSYVPKFIQYTILYELLDLIKMPELDVFDDKFEKDEFFDLLSEIFSYIDEDVINDNRFVDDPLLKSFLFYLKNRDINYEFHEFNVDLKFGDYVADELKKHRFWLEDVSINGDYLNIKGFNNSLFSPNDVSIVAVKEKDGIYDFYTAAYIKNSKRKSTKFLSKTLEYSNNFSLDIPTSDLIDSNFRLRVDFHKNGNKFDNNRENLIFSYLGIFFTYHSKWDKEFSLNDGNLSISLDGKYFNVRRGFKFSVIMAIYNTEDYVEEAIDSVINQTIGFEENIQLILVNDGSTDGTEEILLNYKDQYPDNIVLINQENQGQAAARNNGLNYVNGKYVNFLDSDDYFSENVMEEVYNFFEKNYSKVDLVSVPLVMFGRTTEKHILNYKFNSTRVIDLIKHPNDLQLHVSSSFIKFDALGDNRFPTTIAGSEDSNFVNKILLDKQKLGVVNEGVYFYRKRYDETSTVDIMPSKENYYIPRLKNHFLSLINHSIDKYGHVPNFIQFVIIYDLQWFLSVPKLEVYTKKSEKNEFWYYFNKILSYIDLHKIKNNGNIKSELKRKFLIYLKNKDLHIEISRNSNILLKTDNYQLDNLSNHNLYIDIIEIKKGFLNISGFINSLFDESFLSVDAIKILSDGTEISYHGKYLKYTARKGVMFLDHLWQYPLSFDLKIPLLDDEAFQIKLVVNYHFDGDKSNYNGSNLHPVLLTLKFAPHARMSDVSNYFVKNNKIVYFEDNSFKVLPFSYRKLIKFEKEVRNTINELKPDNYIRILRLRLLYFILYPIMRNKKIYLFMDRIDVADDNGEHLFKYVVSRKDHIKKYFVLSQDSDDYSRISKIGTIIKYNSLKHKLLYLFADKVISSHPDERILNPFFSYDGKIDERMYFNSLVTSGTYFLQHGVKKDDFSDWLKKYDKNLNLLLTVSDLEKQSFLEEGYNYDENVVQVLGLPRHDNLKNNPNKKILFIPTWRSYLEGNRDLFKNSEYYKSINNLLNDEKLISLCEENGYEIIFKSHPKLNDQISEEDTDKYIDLFDFNDHIKISTEESYNKLFEISSILITDYSSVFFDFAYLKKPIIYYQPNDDNHHEDSYFIYETMGFGDVIKDSKELISKIEYYITTDCIMEDIYKNNVDNFFKYHDRNNCQRVYDWIIKN